MFPHDFNRRAFSPVKAANRLPAQKTLELAGITTMRLIPIPADQYPTPTKRPAYSVLRRFALELQGKDDLPPWQQALAKFIELRRS